MVADSPAVISWLVVEKVFSRYLLTTRGRTRKTVTTYVYEVRQFWRRLQGDGIDPVLATADEIGDWLVQRTNEVSGNTVHKGLMSIRAFYTCCQRQGWRRDDPTEGMAVKREEIAPEPPLTSKELTELRAALTLERDRLLLDLLAETGLRIGEAIEGLIIEDINWVHGLIRVHGKGQKQRLAKPPRELMNRLRLFIGGRTSGAVWLSSSGAALGSKTFRGNLDAAAARAGVFNVHPHRLRSGFAIEMLHISGGDIQAVQELLGHSSISSTQRYTQYDKQERALALIERRHALSSAAEG